MAEDSENSNENTSLPTGGSWKTSVLIPAIAIIVIAVATGLASNIKEWFNNKKYSCIVYVRNSGQLLANTPVIWDARFTDSTDQFGKVIFEKSSKGKHICVIVFNGARYRYNVLLDGDRDTVEQKFDISASIVKAIPNKDTIKPAVKNADVDTTNHIAKKTFKEASVSARVPIIVNTQQTASSTSQRSTDNEKVSERKEDNKPKELTATEILQNLQLHVKIDQNDHQNGQVAYQYYLDGSPEYLDKVIEARYKRNHETFSEYQQNKFITSDDRASKFEFIGYQWGYISTTYVQIVLVNNQVSDIYLKSIIYDNN